MVNIHVATVYANIGVIFKGLKDSD